MNEVSPATLVFVHLGPNQSPLLESVAQQATARLKGSSAVLVTDRPEVWRRFPGEVMNYERSKQDRWLDRLERRYPERRLDSGGYWIHTLERIFALERALDFRDDVPLIHLEGDVMSLLTPQIVQALVRHYTVVALPRYTQDLACPSIIFAPSAVALREALDALRAMASRSPRSFTDMQLLGAATRAGVLHDLPTAPADALIVTGHGTSDGATQRVIFDAMALGQYIFGADPVHTHGVRTPGFISSDSALDIEAWTWSITERGASEPTLHADTSDGPVTIANLHLHAKYDPGLLTYPPSEAWRVALEEANGIRSRREYPSSVSMNRYHPAPPWARLLSWRHDGWPRIRDSLRYRLRMSMKRNS